MDAKKQELRAAQAFLTGRLGQTAAKGTDLVEVIVLSDNKAAVYYGLTYTDQGVYAVVRFANAPCLELVHYNRLALGGSRAQLSEDACQCKEPVRAEGGVLCRKCLGNLPARADEPADKPAEKTPLEILREASRRAGSRSFSHSGEGEDFSARVEFHNAQVVHVKRGAKEGRFLLRCGPSVTVCAQEDLEAVLEEYSDTFMASSQPGEE